MKRNYLLEILNYWLVNYLGAIGFILYSSGGSAPKPDPQIGRAALETAQLGRDMFAFYQQEYINNKPAQDKLNALAAQVQEQLVESGKLNNQISKDYYDYMIDVFRPLEKDLVKSANEYDTAGRREAEAAEGLSDVRQAFDTQRDMASRNKERMGVNPNSGNSMALNAQMDTQEAIAGADAMNKGRERAESMGRAMKLDAVSIGKGLPANQATSQQIANSSAQGAVNTGLANAQNNRAETSLMGQGYQGAIQGVSAGGNMLQNQYNSQLQAHQMNQSNSNNQWAGIGALAGTAMMMMSDENVKKDIKDFDDEKALEGVKKTDIKQWKYDGDKVAGLDDVEHVGAMAQDLKRNLGSTVSDGKQVDLISAIGANMAATKALAKKVDKLSSNKKPKGYKNGGEVNDMGLDSVNTIDNDTGEVFEGEGAVRGPGTTTSDSIPARLSDKEYVLNAEATALLGLDVLDEINKRGLMIRGSK